MAKARSLTQSQQSFPDDARYAAFLFERRWPDGFVCPGYAAPASTSMAALLRVSRTPASQSQPQALDRRPRSAKARNRGQEGAFSRCELWGFEKRQHLFWSDRKHGAAAK
jgi:hypothetical protein